MNIPTKWSSGGLMRRMGSINIYWEKLQKCVFQMDPLVNGKHEINTLK